MLVVATSARAMAQARESDRRHAMGRPRGELDGVPIVYKDLIDVAGVATTCGSLTTSRLKKPRSAALVEVLERAGAITIGKANLSEFAFSGLGVNPHFGTPVNPHSSGDEPRVCGGSSSGCAGAVSLAIAAIGVGTDTSGSIRVPAAFCGLVGFRPSASRYSKAGVAALAPSLDSVGIIAANVDDVLRVDAVLHRASGRRRHGVARERTRLDWLGPASRGAASVAVETACERWLRRVSRAGITVQKSRWPAFLSTHEGFGRYGTLVAAEASHVLRDVISSPAFARVDPHIAGRLRQATGRSAADAVALYRLRETLLAQEHEDTGPQIMALPTVPFVAPRISDIDDDSFAAINAGALYFTLPASFLDRPAIALPCGMSDEALPVSIQLVGTRGADAQLLAVAERLERLGLVGT